MEDKISEFLHVPFESLQGINYSVLRKLFKKIDNFEYFEEEVTRLNVLVDEIKSQYYSRISKLSKLLNESSEQKNIASKELSHLQDQLMQDRERCRRKIDALNKQLDSSRDAIKRLNDEKDAKEESMIRQSKHQNVNSVQNVLDKENKLLRRKLMEMENILQTCKSNSVSLQLKYDTIVQEKELMLQNKKWTEEKLSSYNNKTLADESTKASRIRNLEEKLYQVQADRESALSYNQLLLDQNKQLSHSVEEKILEIKNLKDTACIEKTEFSKEMTLQKSMNDLLSSQLASFERDHSSGEIGKDDDNLCKDPDHNNVTDELMNTKVQFQKSQDECQRLQNIISDFVQEDKATVDTNGASHTVGKLFSDIKVLRKQLIKERSQKFQLQNQMEDFILELEHKTPELVSFKERTKSLEHELKRSTELLETISMAKRKDERELTSLRQKINSCEANIHLLVKQRLDLARQVKVLLLNTSAIQKTTLPLSKDDLISLRKILESGSDVNENDAQAIISERLVEFNNINELQEKNVELLYCIRTLADKLEFHEGKKDTTLAEVEKQTIKEAKDAIIELENTNMKMESRINILLRERDSYKLLASSKENNVNVNAKNFAEISHEKKIKELEAELSSTKVESSAVIQNLRKELTTYKKLLCDKKIASQDFENFKMLAKEKESMLETRVNNLKTDLEKQKLSVPSFVQDNKVRDSTELLQSRTKTEILMHEISSLKKETANSMVLKESLTRDLERCCKEKIQLQMMLKESEISLNEQRVNFDSKGIKYDARIKELEESLERLRIELKSKAQEIKSLQSSKDSQLKWAQNTIDDTEEKLKSVLTELSRKEKTVVTLSSKIENLDNELRENKLKYEFLNNTSDASTLQPALRKELEQTQLELKDAHSQVRTCEEIISTNEKALKELNSQLASMKEDYDARIELERKEKLANEEELSLLRRELDEIRGLQPKLKEGTVCLVKQSEKLRNQAEKIQEMKAKIDKMNWIVQVYKKEKTSQFQSIMKANKELSELVTRLEKGATDSQMELKKLKSSLHKTQDLLDTHEKKWMEEKADYERELISNIEQTESLRVENSVLIEKIDSVTEGSDGNEDYLKLVSLFSNLRHERNSLETKLTTCKRDLALVKQKNASLEKNINDLQIDQPASQTELQCSAVIIDEFNDITKEIAQVNLLKENNAILQKSLKNVTEKNREIYEELTIRQEEVSQLKSDLIKTKEQVSVNANKILIYESEMDQCKQRYQDLSTQQREVQKKTIEKLNSEINDFKAKLLDAENTKAELENKFNRLKKQAHEKLDASKKQQTALTNELKELKAVRDKLEQDLNSKNFKTVDLDTEPKEHTVQSGDLLRDQEKVASLPLIEEIESLKRELQVFKNANTSSDAFEKLRDNMEEEKNKIINERTKEFEKKLEEIVSKSKSTGKVADNSENIETLKKEWLKEYEEETIRRIREAEENLKKRIRLPSEERIQKIISKRKEELEEEFQRKLKENASSLTFSCDRKENNDDPDEDLWNSPSKGNSERPSVITDFMKQKNIKVQEQLKNAKTGVFFGDSRSSSMNKENSALVKVNDDKAASTFSFGKPLFPSTTTSFQSFQNPFTQSTIDSNTGVSLPTFNIRTDLLAGVATDTSKTDGLANNSPDKEEITEIGSTLKRPNEEDASSDPNTKKVKESPEDEPASKD